MAKPLLERRWPWLAAGAAILLALLWSAVEIRVPGDWDRRPLGSVDDIQKLRERDDLNVLFILVDTLRAEHLGSYGYARDTSPTLDRMSASGVRFARHLSQSSWTKASMASLWMGRYPIRTGITRFDHVIPEQARMPAEILREAGFQTIGLYRNGWVAPTFGFDQGFEVYMRPAPIAVAADVRRKNPTVSDRATDESVVAAAIEFLRLRGDERWFLYLHLMDVHEYLFDKESALFGVAYSDIYDNAVHWTDRVLEVMLGSLAELGLQDRTLVVVSSDHGEAFGERGFEGHARQVYRETTEVPWLLFLPFRLEPGIVVETRTQNVDVWPTLLDLLGLELPGSDGHSRLPEILAAARGERLPEAAPAIAHLDQTWARPEQNPMPTVAVVEGPLRYVRIPQGKLLVEQLFDQQGDPHEFRDRAREDPETLHRLAGIAEAYLERRPDWGAAPTREINELELNHLRALGYAVP
jgi:arylsulfatase A-like enzyme